MVRKTNVWVGVRPLNPEPFHEIRKELSDVLPQSYQPETDPHITVLQCNLPENKVYELEERARRLALIGRTFTVDRFHCHPNALHPEAIVLNAGIDLEAERSELIEFVRRRNGEPLADPPAPHSTLWIKKNDAYQMDDQTSQQLAERMADLHSDAVWEAKIGDVDVNTF